jgi:hypothetical protein
MRTSRLRVLAGVLLIAMLALGLLIQRRLVRQLSSENERLRQDIAQIRLDKDDSAVDTASASETAKLPDAKFNELLRLRGKVGLLRRETNRLSELLVNSQQHRGPEPGSADGDQAALPDDYPKTADAVREGHFRGMGAG